MERCHQVGEHLGRLGIGQPRVLLRLPSDLNLCSHEAVCLDPSCVVLARQTDHPKGNHLNDPVAVQREVWRKVLLEDAQSRPETPFDGMQDTDRRRVRVNGFTRVRAWDVLDPATAYRPSEEPRLYWRHLLPLAEKPYPPRRLRLIDAISL